MEETTAYLIKLNVWVDKSPLIDGIVIIPDDDRLPVRSAIHKALRHQSGEENVPDQYKYKCRSPRPEEQKLKIDWENQTWIYKEPTRSGKMYCIVEGTYEEIKVIL